MDSTAYQYLICDILELCTDCPPLLPHCFYQRNNTLTPETMQSCAFFLKQIAYCSTSFSDNQKQYALPALLIADKNNYFTRLFIHSHQILADHIDAAGSVTENASKRNCKELVTFLSHAVSPKWVALFKPYDSLDYALCVCLLEAFMYCGWCPNAFEGRAKQAAHIYFNHLKKSLLHSNPVQRQTVLGYLQCAWLLAQRTEGIKDCHLEWKNKDLISSYQWQLPQTPPVSFGAHVLRFEPRSLCIVIPRYPHRIPHPRRHLSDMDTLGLALFSGNDFIDNVAHRESKIINRPKHKGVQFTYSCMIENGSLFNWNLIIQVFEKTIYRIDVLSADSAPVPISHAEFRCVSETPLTAKSPHTYHDRRHHLTLAFITNPFSLVYQHHEHGSIALFSGKPLIIPPSSSISIVKNSCHQDL